MYDSDRHAWDCNCGMLEQSYALRARSEVHEERIVPGSVVKSWGFAAGFPWKLITI